MSFINCFDAVDMVIEEATKQFHPLWKQNAEKTKILEQYCDEIDKLSNEFGGISFEVNVDDIAMTISITLECQDILITEKSHMFYSLIQRAVAVGFSVSNDGNLNIKFVFPSIWDKA